MQFKLFSAIRSPIHLISSLMCKVSMYLVVMNVCCQESVDESEHHNYKELMKVIGWFFFDLFLLGYVEDSVTGLSFSIPGGMGWIVYVEVPSRIRSESPEAALADFIDDVPALGILGVPHAIDHNTPYTVDEDVQLVCKYLKAYWTFVERGQRGINKLYRENRKF